MPPRVLVIRGGALGDFILTLPAIRLLRLHLPTRPHLEILGYKPYAELAMAAGLADEARSIEHSSLAPLFSPRCTPDPALAAYFASFQLIVSFLNDPAEIFHTHLASLTKATVLRAMPRPDDPSPLHATHQLAKALESIALFLDDPAPDLALHPPSRPTLPIIAFHPGSGSVSKNWPLACWGQLMADLHSARPDLQFALITGEAEQERGATTLMIDHLRSLRIPFDHWDSLPLPSLARRLGECQLFLGHDSGISHLAAATGIACLLLFGPSNPAVWAPRNPGAHTIVAPGGQLAQISPEEVKLAALSWLPLP